MCELLDLVAALEGYITMLTPEFHKFLELPVELRRIVYRMYLESEVTGHDRRIVSRTDIRSPVASWPVTLEAF
jgi:hypothetical protein